VKSTLLHGARVADENTAAPRDIAISIWTCASVAAAQQDTEITLEQVGRLAEMGLGPRIIAGTDAGCFDFSFGHMDYCFDLMVAAGLTPMQALKSATSVAAAACGVGNQVGTIQAGKRADIVILGASPLDDVRAVSDVLAVYKDGDLVSGVSPACQPA
jgi:imidazolonepropionase-like amidohydrolase